MALDATAIFAQAKTGGYLYQAELRARLTEYLGVEWGVVRNGTAEIVALFRISYDHAAAQAARADILGEDQAAAQEPDGRPNVRWRDVLTSPSRTILRRRSRRR